MTFFSKIRQWWHSLYYYVIADPKDNSVTLSKRLFRHIKRNSENNDNARVFVFRIPEDGSYGFMVNPSSVEPAVMCVIQYNGKYRCIGFETLCPSVNRIFYDYALESRQTKLSVSVCKTATGKKTFYKFDKPHAKYPDKLPKT